MAAQGIITAVEFIVDGGRITSSLTTGIIKSPSMFPHTSCNESYNNTLLH